MKGRVLIIAGSDSGGGAGIQADIKTIGQLGGYAATAITALTAQNTRAVYDIFPVPPEFIQRQIEVVLDDIGADCIKIGMLATSHVIEAVAKSLVEKATDIPLVLDPVMVATSGGQLLVDDAVKALIRDLLPKATIVTPNIPEATVLTGIPIACLDDMKKAGRVILDMGAGAVLMKGGHMNAETLTDVLMMPESVELFQHPRIETQNTHGTGCTLASGIAAGLAQDMSLSGAVERSIIYVHEAIRTAPGFGDGHGPVNHGAEIKA